MVLDLEDLIAPDLDEMVEAMERPVVTVVEVLEILIVDLVEVLQVVIGLVDQEVLVVQV